jgi:N-acetylated-alpha-linked acidic dipeptidase
MDEVTTFSPIPVLPISYGDALPLLRNLGGAVVPASWKGALPVTYHFGPGPARVHIVLKFDWQTRPLYNVIARIPGARWPDQWVVFGNHHDAWVNGAEDPLSGMVAVEDLESPPLSSFALCGGNANGFSCHVNQLLHPVGDLISIPI